jgi:hypothetical protein
MLTSYDVPQMIYTAARLGIADALKDGPQDVDSLAHITCTHPPTLTRLLRALAGVGLVVAEPDGRCYGLTPIGEYLRDDIPGSQRGMALLYGGPMYQAWQGLAHAVRTGESAFVQVHSEDFYDYLAHHPEAGAWMDTAMDQSAQQWLAAFVADYDFSQIRTLVDVGGGHGALLASVLRANPAMRGILFDLPQVVAGAGTALAQAGVQDRCEVVAGSIFEAAPPGGDAYILARVLFNWNDEQALAILRKCHRAMPPQSKLIVVDGLMPAPGSSSPHAAAQAAWGISFCWSTSAQSSAPRPSSPTSSPRPALSSPASNRCLRSSASSRAFGRKRSSRLATRWTYRLVYVATLPAI